MPYRSASCHAIRSFEFMLRCATGCDNRGVIRFPRTTKTHHFKNEKPILKLDTQAAGTLFSDLGIVRQISELVISQWSSQFSLVVSG